MQKLPTNDINHLYAYNKAEKTFKPAIRPGIPGQDKPADLVTLGEALNTLTDMLANADKLKAKEEAEKRKAIQDKINEVDTISQQMIDNPNISEFARQSLRKLAQERQELKG